MTTTMATMQKKSLNHAEEIRTFNKGKVDLVKLGEITVGRATFEPGWKWSECIKPTAGTESCQAPHFGYVISGRMQVAMQDGTQAEFGPGDVMQVPPGHDAWILGDEPCVCLDFAGLGSPAKPVH